jgi:N-carbamoylputrescine amidase
MSTNRTLQVTVFLSHPERDGQTGKLYNSVLVIGTNGTILGTHWKINTLRVGSEAWSSPGDQAVPISVPPFSRVGVLICADAYSPGIARSLKAQGAQLLYPPPRGFQASMGRMANGNNVPATRDWPFWSAIGRDPTGH